MIQQFDPPPLNVLWSIAHRLGYENPLVEIGDMLDGDQRVGAVRVQLWGNPVRRNVAGTCRVLPIPGGEDVAIRSAFAKALELAADAGAIT